MRRTVEDDKKMKPYDQLIAALLERKFCIVRTGPDPILTDAVDLHNPRMPDQVAGDRIRVGFLQDSLIVAITLDTSRRDNENRIENLCTKRSFERMKNLPGMVCQVINGDTDTQKMASELCSAFHGV